MSETIDITINGQTIQAKPGEMLIDVADDNGITIPRFCYHKKLSVSANCRMCLVEVEKAPKPLPACATPIADGMVVKTQSNTAISAQKSTMEFLLINHPLDCPVCDQGGECELQDVAMGFGGDVSQYTDTKRVVCDKDIGSLVATEMTRCIHCTRCVRFSEEIAGIPELGGMGRGEFIQMSTYVDNTVDSELSGNLIDVCPVGALTAKPSKFSARCWEMTSHASVAAHDCVGSNINIHTVNNEVIRVVPKNNEAINECWISDRDRFSYTGLKSESRLTSPKIKKDGKFVDVDWQEAIDLVAQKFSAQANKNATKIAALVSPSTTLEEQFLTQKLVRSLGSNNIDYRLAQSDFSNDSQSEVMPWLGRSLASLEELDGALFIASNPRKEQPILGHRVRKAVIQNNAKVSFVNHVAADLNYQALENIANNTAKLTHELAAVAVAVASTTGVALSENLTAILEKTKAKKEHKNIAKSLIDGDQTAVFIGQQAINSPYYSLIKEIAEFIATQTSSSLGLVTQGANASGAALAGCVPYAQAGGEKLESAGLNKDQILQQEEGVNLLVGINPKLDVVRESVANANFNVALTTHFDASSFTDVDVILPMAAFAETSGTYVNIEGRWQSFNGAVKALGNSRPGWKIINSLMRVLLPSEEFEVNSSAQARDELKALCQSVELNNVTGTQFSGSKLPSKPRALQSVYEESLYSSDDLVRASSPLSATEDYKAQSMLSMNAEQASKEGLTGATSVSVTMGEQSVVLPFRINERVAAGSICIPRGLAATENLSALFAAVSVEQV
ncbi:MAG: NADH-quinone oxidoreductase subunit G [Gammaproteobacteria bacterium]|nr:NADH-quinone oxidoreductase subunit G [Gammaproteobacteria bacterium]